MRLLVLLLLFPCWLSAQKGLPDFTDRISAGVMASSNVMMHDVVNPPAASRFYFYIVMGAYDIMAQSDSTIPRLSKLIRNYPDDIIVSVKRMNPQLAAAWCILETGRLMLPSGFLLQEDQTRFISDMKKQKVDTAILKASIAVGNLMAKNVTAFAKGDRYGQLSARLRYTPIKGEAFWYPTPPAYIEAVEPNWKIIRPVFLDSATEFRPLPPVSFSKDSSSPFFAITREVYTVSKTRTKEQLNMAAFWDCNPFAVATSGHMSIGYKKISPGGHWMNITGIASKKAKLSFSKTILAYTMVAASIMDGFISCWDEKYRSNRIRPETVINRYIDVRWQPLLQTPPFPEYPSGHSVISAAAAEVLTYLLGENFSYVDDSEKMFDLPARSFKSFHHASAEAAISRLYGGIHFRDAVEEGQKQGTQVGAKAVAKIKTAGIKPLR